MVAVIADTGIQSGARNDGKIDSIDGRYCEDVNLWISMVLVVSEIRGAWVNSQTLITIHKWQMESFRVIVMGDVHEMCKNAVLQLGLEGCLMKLLQLTVKFFETFHQL